MTSKKNTAAGTLSNSAKILTLNGSKNAANTIDGTVSNEHINGGARIDTINGKGGDDFINSGADNDIIDGGAGSDKLDGDSGDDLAIYVAAENQNGAARFADVYIGGSGIDTLRLVLSADEAANPVLQAEIAAFRAFIAANTLPNGQAKNVDFVFTSLNLTVNRFEKLELQVADDECDCEDKFVIDGNTVIINGTDGADEIFAEDGAQTIYGGGGDDTIGARGGGDQISGGDGNDTVAGDRGADIICGDAGNDFLLGNGGRDDICGGAGSDQLFGGEGDDVVSGGSGNDFVSGDEGSDTMIGGSGSDEFAYGKLTGTLEFGNDVIEDFAIGAAGDTIRFINLGANFDTYVEVISAAAQTADGVLFDFGNDRTLLVRDVVLADLTSDYFLF